MSQLTIKDIARLCGVSVSTVSRALNDRPDVNAETKRRILSVIEEANYIPNYSARDLVRTDSNAIGLVVRGISNPFYSDIIHAIEQETEKAGYTMVMRHIAICDDEIQCGAEMERAKRLRGIIFLGGESDYTHQRISALNVPFVCCAYSNEYGELSNGEYSSVSIEDTEEAYRAVTELYNNGHRRIAALVSEPDDRSISQLRYQGYKKALRDMGLEYDDALVIKAGTFDIEDAYRQTLKKIDEGADFTAIFAIADNMALGAERALRERGRRIPDDCSVIAIDGLELSAYVEPILTTLCQPTEEMGRKSARILLDMIEGRGGNRVETVRTTLRRGASVRKIN